MVLPPLNGLALLWLSTAVVALVVVADEVSARRAVVAADGPEADTLIE